MNYRQVTVVIGILVALLIALTLWTAGPRDVVPRERSLRGIGFVPAGSDPVDAATHLVIDIE